MRKVYIALDNGVTGTFCILSEEVKDFFSVPVKKEQNYTKKKDIITRLDAPYFAQMIEDYRTIVKCDFSEWLCVMERPMINPDRFNASISAARCFEAELCLIERVGIPHIFVDSKQWQKELLPAGLKGSVEQKKASHDIGCRLFPQFAPFIKKHKDADALLMAYWARGAEL